MVHAAIEGLPSAPIDRPPWLTATVYVAVSLALCTGLLVGTMFAALAVSLALPGIAGPVVFLGLGLTLVATTPTVARRSVTAIHDARYS